MFDIDIPGDPVLLREAADGHDRLAEHMRAASSRVAGVDTSELTGAAADAMRTKKQKVSDGLNADADGYAGVARQLREAADKLEQQRTEVHNKLIALAAGAAAAAVVGFALTWLTGGVSTVVGEWAAGTAAAAAIAEATLITTGLIETVTTVVAWVGIHFTIGLLEGITFTLTQEGVSGQPIGISSQQWKQIAAIATGNTIGRGIGLGVGSGLAGLIGTEAAATTAGGIGIGAGSGLATGTSLGFINPILVASYQGKPVDWATVGESTGINAGLGLLGGGALGGLSNTGYGNLVSTVRTIRTGNAQVPAGNAGAGEIEAVPTNGSQSSSSMSTVQGENGAVVGGEATQTQTTSTPAGADDQTVRVGFSVDQNTGNVRVTMTANHGGSDGTGTPSGTQQSATSTTEIAPDGHVVRADTPPATSQPAPTGDGPSASDTNVPGASAGMGLASHPLSDLSSEEGSEAGLPTVAAA